MHRSRLTLALMTCLAVPGFACAAAKKDTKQKLPDCTAMRFDGSNLTEEENDFFFSNQKNLSTSEFLRFALGRDSVLADFYAQRKRKAFNADVLKLRELANSQGLARQMSHDLAEAESAYKQRKPEHKWTKDTADTLFCRIDAIGDTLGQMRTTHMPQAT